MTHETVRYRSPTHRAMLELSALADERGWNLEETRLRLPVRLVLRARYWSHGTVTIDSDTTDLPRLKAIISALPDLTDPGL